MGTHATLEAELFGILVDLLADKKLERNALRVQVGARGFELGRPYLHLCQQGLIEEHLVRPGFFARLFGARETLWVRVTDYGRKVAAELAPEVQAVAAPVADDQPPHQAALPNQEDASTIPHEEPAVILEDMPVEPAKPKAKRKKSATPPRRFKNTDFTDTLGGAPLDAGFAIPASDRLDGLAELVGLLGFELTDAGRMLATNRWTGGQTDAQVSLEIVSTALAHAVRLNAKLDQEAALGLVSRTNDAFMVFVSEGLLDADSLTVAIGEMAGFLTEPISTSGVNDYLSDPLRGIAPPAICPDDIYLRVSDDD